MAFPMLPAAAAALGALALYVANKGKAPGPVVAPPGGGTPAPIYDGTIPAGLANALSEMLKNVGGESADYLLVSASLFNNQGFPVTSQTLLSVANYLRASLNPLSKGAYISIGYPVTKDAASQLVSLHMFPSVPVQVQWILNSDGTAFAKNGPLDPALAATLLGVQPGGVIAPPPVIQPPPPQTNLPHVDPIPPPPTQQAGPPKIQPPPPQTNLPPVEPIPPPPVHKVVDIPQPASLTPPPGWKPSAPPTPVQTPPPQPPPPPPVPVDPMLALAQAVAADPNNSANVSAFQQGFNAAGGNPPLTVDGKYGPKTAAAVNLYTSGAPPALNKYVPVPGGGGGYTNPPDPGGPIDKGLPTPPGDYSNPEAAHSL